MPLHNAIHTGETLALCWVILLVDFENGIFSFSFFAFPISAVKIDKSLIDQLSTPKRCMVVRKIGSIMSVDFTRTFIIEPFYSKK